jgi:hypothetical protein
VEAIRSRIAGCRLLNPERMRQLVRPSGNSLQPAGRAPAPRSRLDAVVLPAVVGERDPQIERQALAQEQAVFERKMKKDHDLFRLQLAMGWTTFLMVPISVVAIAFYPAAAAGLVPLNGLAAWNWRRMLRRDSEEIEVTTKPPAALR